MISILFRLLSCISSDGNAPSYDEHFFILNLPARARIFVLFFQGFFFFNIPFPRVNVENANTRRSFIL
jgi:hypothetical protein